MTITLSLTQATLAAYKPPRDQKPPSGYTDSSGVRGRCKTTGTGSLTLLAPITHVGQTTSAHPTFAWFVTHHQRMPIEFSVYEFDNNEQPHKLVYRSEVQSSPGIMKLSLPKEQPGLSVGQKYLWQVEILCNRNRPSRNLLASAEIEVVAIPASLKDALNHEQDRTQRATLYAEAGMWYDALSEALNTSNTGALGIVAANLIQDLAKLEKSPKSEDLSQIALGEN
ncbi:MAG: DUF928 domain-containing protein [Fischerella sp.]|nr:DUF928 domain-containing protein [Fischerella sp.]